jgi:uncharacterized caspase-like protein
MGLGLIVAATMSLAAAAYGDERVALVIGNSAYRTAPPLLNPRNDAEDVGRSLAALGFATIVAVDLDRAAMNDALERFSRIVKGADIALVYYAGHGMQLAGRNYLLPVDARLDGPEDVNRFRLMPLDDILEVMQGAPGARVVILDACRNNPVEEMLKRRIASAPGASRDAVLSRGLMRISAGNGLIVAYATQADEVAGDGRGRNSPFTAAFLHHVATPDLDLRQMFFRVQDEVDRETSGRQRPELSISLVGEFKLRLSPPVLPPPPLPAGPALDELTWGILKGTTDIAALRRFLEEFPQSTRKPEAETRIAALENEESARVAARENEERMRLAAAEETRRRMEADLRRTETERERTAADERAWSRTLALNTAEAFRTYLGDMPQGAHRQDAEQAVARRVALSGQWQSLRSGRSIAALRAFAADARLTEFEQQATTRLNELTASEGRDFAALGRDATLASLRSFVTLWRDGDHAADAAARIAELEDIAQQWASLRDSRDEAALEDFVSQHGWSEFGAEATVRLVSLRTSAAKDGRGVRFMTATEMAPLIDGAALRLAGSGQVIQFDAKSSPPYRARLGQQFLKAQLKENFVLEGGFRASASSGSRDNYEGIGGIIASRVDGTGSLFLLQMHGSERRAQDIESRDRKFATLNVIRDTFGFVCAITQWQSLLASTKPPLLVERCTIQQPELSRARSGPR